MVEPIEDEGTLSQFQFQFPEEMTVREDELLFRLDVGKEYSLPDEQEAATPLSVPSISACIAQQSLMVFVEIVFRSHIITAFNGHLSFLTSHVTWEI